MLTNGPKIVVLGATCVDMAFRCDHMPAEGQEVVGSGLCYTATGPGPNQALQAVHCGCEVNLISKVGGGPFGSWVKETIANLGVNTDYMVTAEAMNTGLDVTIVSSQSGDNASLRYAGANSALHARDIEAAEAAIAEAAVCLIHGHLPQEALIKAVRCAGVYGTRVILNPATPLDCGQGAGVELPLEFFGVDIMVANLSEAAALVEQSSANIRTAKMVGSDLVARGVGCVLITMGRRGCMIVDRNGAEHVPAFDIELVDRTGRGDAFAGALAASVAVGDKIHDAVTFASAAGALACTVFGSIESMPTKAEIIQLLQDQG
jgi:ribokinase